MYVGWSRLKNFMASVVPAVLAATPAEYKQGLQKVEGFARRLHIDIADGEFAPSTTIRVAQVYGPENTQLDLHLMLAKPASQLDNAISLKPHLITVHAEAEVDIESFMNRVRPLGIKAGLAVLPATTIDEVARWLPRLDHLLVFLGDLGHYGGDFNSACLPKIGQARAVNPNLEISVDGGVNTQTAPAALAAGADVLISGSFIQQSSQPTKAFRQLEKLAA